MKLLIGLLLIVGAAAATPAGEYSFKATTAGSLRGEAALGNCATLYEAAHSYPIACTTYTSPWLCRLMCKWQPVHKKHSIPGNHCCVESDHKYASSAGSGNNGHVETYV